MRWERTLVGIAALLLASHALAAEPKKGEFTLQFEKRVAESSRPSLYKAFNERPDRRGEEPGEYLPADATFDVFVPETYEKSQPHGLLVWLSGESDAPPDWRTTLTERKLIWVAIPSAAVRDDFDAAAMAIDAVANLARRYNLDKRRICVGASALRADVALRMGLAMPSVFGGVVAVGGGEYCKRIYGVSASGNRYYREGFPKPPAFGRAQRDLRIVFIMDRDTPADGMLRRMIEDGYREDGFAVKVLEIPANARPDAAQFKEAIEAIDGPPAKPRAAKATPRPPAKKAGEEKTR